MSTNVGDNGELREPGNDSTGVLQVLTDEHLSIVGAGLAATTGELAPGNALLIVTRGGVKESQFLIDADETTLGRHPESDIFLDDITVSRHHARLLREDGRIAIEDRGSLNGTYVNRTLIEGRAQLRHGDEIQIGKYRATILMSESGRG
ncbi:FHA domain-containing protein [Arachnia propionica]|uniref:FHA domain-containing protein n=1 Tax=Arachnia propionica TaxID=1750 RepID=A0A3P1WY82_9ACTN|nr:FHA domain-containing protein [Arachnia propionica]RRD51145.1 FHA domain-containing protein [Arachnia propionica]